MDGNYDERCDVWSLGVIMYIMLSGEPPFNGPTDNSIMRKIAKGKYKMEGKLWDSISNQAKDLISRMLTFDYKNRPYAKDLLQDPWFDQAPKTQIDQTLMQDALMNLRNFRANQKLQQATL